MALAVELGEQGEKPCEEIRALILDRIRVIEEEELPRLRLAAWQLADPARRGRRPKQPK